MSNRITKGKARVGSISVDTSGGVGFGNDLAVEKYLVIPFTAAASTSEQNSGYQLPSRCKVRAVDLLFNTAASAGAVISVGLLSSSSGGVANGFLNNASATGTGLVQGTVTIAAASSGVASTTFGTFLMGFVAASSTNASGTAVPKSFLSDSITARSVSWTLNSSSNTTATGRILIDLVDYTT